jgi:pyruvate dehydrogenase (quinone)
VKTTLSTLLPLRKEKQDDTRCKNLNDLAVGRLGRKSMHPQYVAKIVDELAAAAAIFSCYVGTRPVSP